MTAQKKQLFLSVNDVPVVCMQGRVHYYEGYAMSDVVLPTRLMRLMGAKILFVTNASGGINPSFECGDFMMITDHIMNFVPSPLIGKNIDEMGPRFPDMSDVYKKELQGDKFRDVAKFSDSVPKFNANPAGLLSLTKLPSIRYGPNKLSAVISALRFCKLTSIPSPSFII